MPQKNPNSALWAIFGAALAGLGISIEESKHFYDLMSGTGGFRSFCNLSAAMNCDLVATSRYAELFGGVPVSSAAAGWFLGVAVLAIMSTGDGFRAAGARALRLLGAAGLGISLFFLGIMIFVLHTGCLMCLGVDAVSLAIAALAWLALPREPAEFPTQKFVAVMGASLFVAIVALKGMDEARTRDLPVDAIVNEIVASPVIAVNAGPEFPSIGPASAPLTIVEFSDFQCPFCRLAAVTLHTVMDRYPGKIRLVMRNFPLNAECNRGTQNTAHPYACDLARTAICANRQGKFEPFYEMAFENQADLKPGKPQAWGESVGVASDFLKGCAASPETASAISRDVEEGIQLGVQSTPTLFVNGHRVNGGYPLPVWTQVIDRLLAQQAR